MDLTEIGIDVLIGIIYAAPWVVAIILASKMLEQSGGKPERSLLIGASLMLASSIFATIFEALQPHLIAWLERVWMFSIISTVRDCITLVGVSFLIYAFWTKFHAKT